MELNYFPHFIRANFPENDLSNEDAITVGKAFKDYLIKKFINNPDKLEKIWDISPRSMINNMNHPFKVNGYDPVLVLHFTRFVEQKQAKSAE